MTPEQSHSFKYHEICARATLYPGKSLAEVTEIVDKKFGLNQCSEFKETKTINKTL
jgi:hypothetical protein